MGFWWKAASQKEWGGSTQIYRNINIKFLVGSQEEIKGRSQGKVGKCRRGGQFIGSFEDEKYQ